MRRFLFLTSSARAQGNSVLLAQAAARHLPPEGTQVWTHLATLPLPAFQDLRPTGRPPDGALAEIWAEMQAATDLVFVAPVYWYALPAPAKLLLDHWSGWLDAPGMAFVDRLRGKGLWLITARADPDPTVTEAMEAMLHRSARWLGMTWKGALHGIGDAAGEVRNDQAAMTQAARFFRA